MIDVFRGAERLMRMDDAAWRRHANGWSVATRFTVLPLIALALWSRTWLGWGALGPLALALAWTWINPRLFAPPVRFDSWSAKGLLGERIFLEHRAEIPAHHRHAAHALAAASVPGVLVLAWGLWTLAADWTLFGLVLAIGPKAWFADRMVWIFEDWRRRGRPVPGVDPHEL
ncbi:DUF6653 family protein [Pseudaestuariivita sp.]|uniref:DUF6653 family protein n=1 Tax=Pseudaestuariivita sp. TaxID=2211669 RepID=UPI0040599B24